MGFEDNQEGGFTGHDKRQGKKRKRERWIEKSESSRKTTYCSDLQSLEVLDLLLLLEELLADHACLSSVAVVGGSRPLGRPNGDVVVDRHVVPVA